MIVPNTPDFIRFSTSHISMLIVAILLFFSIPYLVKKNPNALWINHFSKFLGILLIGNELIWVLYKLSIGHNYWAEFMPFELCTINAYLVGIILIFLDDSLITKYSNF